MELLVTITIFGALVLLVAPSTSTTARIHGLRGAARQTFAELQNARETAVMENRRVQFQVTGSRSYQVLHDLDQDGTFADPGEVVSAKQIESAQVTLAGGNVSFTPKGTATAASTLTVSNSAGESIVIQVSPAGRIRIN